MAVYAGLRAYATQPNWLSLAEEADAAIEVDLMSEGPDDEDVEDGEVAAYMQGPVVLYSVRSRVVRKAAAVVRARLGGDTMVDKPANRLVISREFRLWATELGVRPKHIVDLEPYVVERCFIPTASDRHVATIRARAARAKALNSTNRRSLYLTLFGRLGLGSVQ